MNKILKNTTYLLFLILIMIINVFPQESSNSMVIQDFDKLQNFEENVIDKLNRREPIDIRGSRVKITFALFAGAGAILPVGIIKDSFKTAVYVNFGVYFNISVIPDLYASLEADIIKMKAISKNTVYQGVEVYTIKHDDGKFTMIPILFGLEYRFRLFDNFYISPKAAVGISFNKIKLPSRVNEDSSIGYEASSTDLVLKGSFTIHYFIVKGFSVKAFVNLLFVKQTETNGMFLSFGALLAYRF